MSKYIDADKVVDKLVKADNFYWDSIIDQDNAISVIEAAPAVDVAPIIHARWDIDKENTFFPYRCSFCGMTELAQTPYCPNCGAKMR